MVIPTPLPDAEPEPDIRRHTNEPHSHLEVNDAGAPHDAPATPGRRTSAPSTLSDVAPLEEDDWEQPTVWASVKNTVRAVPVLAALPVLLPVAWALHFTHQNPIAVFVVSLLAIIPLAGGLSFATEELATHLGDAWGGLLNASFGNAVELLIAILALVKGELGIVQASMAGSILSNILLVLGMSYFAGGLRFHEQLYAIVGAQTHIALLGISIAAILLPEAFHLAYPSTRAGAASRGATVTIRGGSAMSDDELKTILAMSRGLSFLLLAVYAMYLTFQLWTHAYLFKVVREVPSHLPEPNHVKVFPRPHWVPSLRTVVSRDTYHADGHRTPSPMPRFDGNSLHSPSHAPSHVDLGTVNMEQPSPLGDLRLREKRSDSDPASPNTIVVHTTGPSESSVDGSSVHDLERGHQRHEVPKFVPRVSIRFAMASLAVFTGLAGLTAECLVDSIDGLTEQTSVSKEFVGLIILPVVGNAVEHITAVTVSLKDRLNLSLSIAVGSSVQVSLCILPLLVILGWIIGQPMSLLFDTFETIALVVAVVLVNFAISDGRTNYLEGFTLMMAYIAIALVCWFYDPAY